jgi:hypothetical protein
MTIAAFLLQGLFPYISTDKRLDAAFIIPAARGFPDLPAGKAPDGTLKLAMDCEGLVLKDDGSFLISDEYGRNIRPHELCLIIAYVYHFSVDGVLIEAFAPPDAFIPKRNGTESFSANSPPRDDPNAFVIPANPKSGRQNNQGFEGMSIDPKEKLLYVLLQSSTIQDGGTASTRRNTRLLERDLKKNKWTGEWVVQLPTFDDNGTKVAAQSELHFLDKDRFFVLARDSGKGFGTKNSTSLYRHVYTLS